MVLLGHQLGYNNILSMYAVLFLLLPGFLWLNAVRPRLLFAVSAALWLAAGCFKMVPYNFLDDGYWFLNPWSWQFLFVIGILCMPTFSRSSRARARARAAGHLRTVTRPSITLPIAVWCGNS